MTQILNVNTSGTVNYFGAHTFCGAYDNILFPVNCFEILLYIFKLRGRGQIYYFYSRESCK